MGNRRLNSRTPIFFFKTGIISSHIQRKRTQECPGVSLKGGDKNQPEEFLKELNYTEKITREAKVIQWQTTESHGYEGKQCGRLFANSKSTSWLHIRGGTQKWLPESNGYKMNSSTERFQETKILVQSVWEDTINTQSPYLRNQNNHHSRVKLGLKHPIDLLLKELKRN